MENAIIILVLVVIIGAAIYGIVHRARYGSSCCGRRDPGEKRVRVKDKNKEHYPHTYVLGVEGMYCKNCARRVENAFNAGEGRWAKADVEHKEVILRSKNAESESDLAGIMSSAGYTMLSCEAK